MNAPQKRSSLLCPNCRRLVSRSAPECPSCGLKKPGSMWKNNIFTGEAAGQDSVIKLIMVTNIIFFVVSVLIDPKASVFSSSPFDFLSPTNNSLLVLGSTGTIPCIELHRWWTLVSASFLHGSLLHLVFNMIVLNQLGPLIIQEYGSSRMITIYTLSGIGGFLLSVVVGIPFTLGASAAICGLIGAALYYGKSRGGTYGNAIYSQIGGWALGIFIFGLVVPGINNWGHGGGMAAGALVAFLLGYKERTRESIIHRFMSMGSLICTALILVWALVNGAFFLLLR